MVAAGSRNRELSRPTVRFVLGIVLLLIVRAVVNRLPMLANESMTAPGVGSGVPMLVPYNTLAAAVVDAVMLIWISRFGRDVGSALKVAYPHIADIQRITIFFSALIAVVLAYNMFGFLGYALFGNSKTYDLLFLGGVSVPLVALAALLYKNLDSLTDIVLSGLESSDRAATCECGHRLTKGQAFCSRCGKAVMSTKPQSNQPLVCPKCAAQVSSDATYCAACGAALNTATAAERVIG